MGYTAREFEQYILRNRKEFVALSARQERELGRLYLAFAEQAKMEASYIVNKEGLTYAAKKQLISELLRKAARLTDNFKSYLDQSILETAGLKTELDKIIAGRYQTRLQGIGADLDLIGLIQDIPDKTLRIAYSRIWEDGLKLSDRIWIIDRRTKRELERIILEEIAAGRSASSKVLEGRLNKLLAPGRQAVTTSLHGRNVSFDVARLLRTERTVAYREADRQAAMANPGNRGIKWKLSPAERNCSTCSTLATQDNYGLGPGIYPPDKLPVTPHPQCMCSTYQIVISTDELARNWVEWMDNKSTHPELTEWYRAYYRKAA